MESQGNNFKSKNFFVSLKHALDGIVYGIKNCKNLRIDLVFFVLVIILSFILRISFIEWIAVIICSFVVLSLELLNTAIEEAVNLAMPNINQTAKNSKDIAAGAVLLSAFMSLIVGLIIFIPKIISLF